MNERFIESTIVYKALKQHVQQESYSLHVPGHHQGQFYTDLIGLDTTELSSTDDLYAPQSILAEAERRIAEQRGSKQSYMLVGGSTVGNLAMILATLGGKANATGRPPLLLSQRNVHKSLVHAYMLAQVDVVFMESQMSEAGFPLIPSQETLEQAWIHYPEAEGIVLSSPNYWGQQAEHLHAMIQWSRSKGLTVFVDEAHGAHYSMHPRIPKSAITMGADYVVQSWHKSLGALTMAAVLHVNDENMTPERMKRTIAMIQTSSPSFPIMASIDLVRAWLDDQGANNVFTPPINAVDQLLENDMLQSFGRIGISRLEQAAAVQCDPLRIVIYDRKGGLSGQQLLRMMEQVGIYGEYAEHQYALLIIPSTFHTGLVQGTIDRLQQLDEQLKLLPSSLEDKTFIYSKPKALASFTRIHCQLWNQQSELISSLDSVNRRSVAALIPYPPGIPLVLPNEMITYEHVSKLTELLEAQVHIQGMNEHRQIEVWVEEEYV